jgi:hypothetical protein
MRDATREALTILQQSNGAFVIPPLPSQAQEGAEVVVLPVGDRDRIGCFIDQVKLTRTLV